MGLDNTVKDAIKNTLATNAVQAAIIRAYGHQNSEKLLKALEDETKKTATPSYQPLLEAIFNNNFFDVTYPGKDRNDATIQGIYQEKICNMIHFFSEYFDHENTKQAFYEAAMEMTPDPVLKQKIYEASPVGKSLAIKMKLSGDCEAITEQLLACEQALSYTPPEEKSKRNTVDMNVEYQKVIKSIKGIHQLTHKKEIFKLFHKLLETGPDSDEKLQHLKKLKNELLDRLTGEILKVPFSTTPDPQIARYRTALAALDPDFAKYSLGRTETPESMLSMRSKNTSSASSSGSSSSSSNRSDPFV